MATMDREQARRRSPGAIAFAAASIALTGSASVVVLLRWARSLDGEQALVVATALPLGLFAADLVSALVHWFCDTFLDPETPLVGRVIGPFRLHHDDPGAFRRHGFLERNRNTCLAALPLLALAGQFSPRADDVGRTLLGAVLAVAAVALAGATQIHAWAHDSHAPRPVRWLQRCGLLLSPQRHEKHHQGFHGRSYAIVNGWANGGLDRTKLFRRAETLALCIGLRPSNVDRAPRGGSDR